MSETPVEGGSGIAIGALSIQRRVILRNNHDDLAFSFAIDSTTNHADIFDVMDTIQTIVERESQRAEKEEAHEKLMATLAERREALRRNGLQIKQFERDIELAEVNRLAYIAAREANKQAGGRRLEWKPNDKQKADLEQFATQTANLRANRKQFVADIPMIEWEIADLEARLAGNESPPRPPEVVIDEAMTLAEAAE